MANPKLTKALRNSVRRLYRLARDALVVEPVPKKKTRNQAVAPSPESQSCKEHVRTFGEAACQARAFVNIGPGKWRHPYWQNLDILQPKYRADPPDIEHNLMSEKPLPIADGSISAFYCSHVIEHLTDSADAVLFREVHRCLEKGGVFRLVFPNVDVAIEAYRRDDRTLFLENWPRPGNRKRLGAPCEVLLTEFFAYHRLTKHVGAPIDGYRTYTDEEIVSWYSRSDGPEAFRSKLDGLTLGIPAVLQDRNPGCHRNWWNVEKLMTALRTAGFRNVYPSQFLQSSRYALRNRNYFDQTHPEFSGYVEAVKD